MERLALGDFRLARPVFEALDHHLAVRSSLSGETPAEIYVDRCPYPRAAVLIPWNRHRIYLAGTPADPAFGEAFSALVRQRYTPSSRDAGPFQAIIYYAPTIWETTLATLFAEIPSRAASRHYYRLSAPLDMPVRVLPAGCLLRRIDHTLCEDEALTDRGGLLNEIASESPSVEDFLQHKFGYCAQRSDELVGWCLSEYNHGHRCELGVETTPRLQRQGIASALVAATVAHALANGITDIGWHCWAANASSIAVATSLGFAKTADYPVWFCRFDIQPNS